MLFRFEVTMRVIRNVAITALVFGLAASASLLVAV